MVSSEEKSGQCTQKHDSARLERLLGNVEAAKTDAELDLAERKLEVYTTFQG